MKHSQLGISMIELLVAMLISSFLIIGVIASVRHILSVGSSLTLSTGKTTEAFDRGILELIVNGGIVIALVVAILITRQAENAHSLATPKKITKSS